MPKVRSHHEIDLLVELAREYCSSLALYRCAKSEGRLNGDDELRAQTKLARLDKRLTLQRATANSTGGSPCRRRGAR